MKELEINGAITGAELELTDKCVDIALSCGASAIQITLDKAKNETYSLLDGEIDNIRQSGDRSLNINLFVDGKYGVFSTNRLDGESLRQFIAKSVENVRFLAEDQFRKLPDPATTAKTSPDGNDMGLCWGGYDSVTAGDKLAMARRVSVFGEYSKASPDRDWRVVSEEIEYSNSFSDTYLTNSDRIHCRQVETSFEICSQITVEDGQGDKYSGLWWDYGISPDKARASDCGHKALMQAVSKISPKGISKGDYTMVVSNRVAGKLLQPLLNALSGRSIQQKSSFLTGTLDSQVFSKDLNIIDEPHAIGKCGSSLFEPDGRATETREIITDGVVKEYFINTYMSGKLGMPATSDFPNRPVVKPFISSELGGEQAAQEGIVGEAVIMSLCGKGILVTDFNGGNCNAATGDFSYGVEGFIFEDGKIVSPVDGMLITGNMITLWSNITAAGNDPLEGLNKQVPTLAFKNVTFSA